MYTKLVRLTHDAETRTNAQTQKQSIQIKAAYNIGWGDKKESVFISGAYYQQAEKLLPYLTKGSQVVLTMDDVKPYHNHKDGKDYIGLYCVVRGIELAGSKNDNAQQSPQPVQQKVTSGAGFADFDDSDIPFMRIDGYSV